MFKNDDDGSEEKRLADIQVKPYARMSSAILDAYFSNVLVEDIMSTFIMCEDEHQLEAALDALVRLHSIQNSVTEELQRKIEKN